MNNPDPGSNTVANGEPPISILIYGLGAIGSFVAFILQRNSNVRLSVVVRSNYAAVASHGVQIDSENHGSHVFRPAAVLKHPNEAVGQVFDFIVCTNKATDLPGTVEALRSVVTCEGERRTTIVLMQNGVGIEDPFHDAFPGCTILSAVVWIGATQLKPGHVKQHLSESTTLGVFTTPPTSSPSPIQLKDLDAFTTLLTTSPSPTPVTIHPQIQTPRWQKTIWNAAWNTLTTLTGVDVHTWLSSSDCAMATTRTLMHEAVIVAQAAGVPDINGELVDELIGRMQNMSGPVWTSMYYDAKAGRAMEVDVIIGGFVREAKRRGVEVPTLRIVYAMLLAVQGRISKSQ